jgi:hypothetical protein
MTDLIPLILLFTAWVPIAAGIAWVFERKPRDHQSRSRKARNAGI